MSLQGIAKPVDDFFWPASELHDEEETDEVSVFNESNGSSRAMADNCRRSNDLAEEEEDNDNFLFSSTSVIDNEQKHCHHVSQMSNDVS